MSAKRRAEKELTHDNWDAEDEPEESGTFRKASEDVLKSRVIRTAKRRVPNGDADTERQSIFSGFSGFGSKKTEERKTNFSFLSNNMKGEDTVDEIKDTAPKPQFSFSSGSTGSNYSLSFPSNSSNFASTVVKPAQSSLSFKSDNVDNASKLNSLSTKLKTVASDQQTVQKQSIEPKGADTAQTSDEIFLKKLRSLNLLCAEWIIKHLNENLSYILTPIFDDYKKHLTQLREEKRLAGSTCKKAKIEEEPEPKLTHKPEPTKTQFTSGTSLKETAPKFNFGIGSFLSNKETDASKESKPAKFSLNKEEKSGFNFFSQDKKDESPKTFNFTPSETKFDSGFFKFKANEGSTSTTSSTTSTDTKSDSDPFKFKTSSFGTSTSTTITTEPLPPSFFAFKPPTNSTFNQNAAPKADETETEHDGPPPMEDVTIKEEGSVYDKKCKIFIKKDGNYVDHGVGFLFLKLVGDEQKCQMIVRANNKLANIITNTLLSASMPVQKMGKNNVMIVCCPTPETKQPTPVLVKVKSAEDADELINALNKYRK